MLKILCLWSLTVLVRLCRPVGVHGKESVFVFFFSFCICFLKQMPQHTYMGFLFCKEDDSFLLLGWPKSLGFPVRCKRKTQMNFLATQYHALLLPFWLVWSSWYFN